ncbi:MAG: phytoene desaturase family protein [Rhodothermales bacterium]
MSAPGDVLVSKNKEAIVIGAGFGGLSIANRLQSAGMQVTLLEKRPKVGGRAYQFIEKGYTFDMGPSLITAPDLIDDIFEQAGRSASDYFDLLPLDPYYRIYFHDNTYIDYSGDAEQMKAQMRKFNHKDAEQYDAFMKAIAPIYDEVITKKLGAQPFDTAGSMLRFTPRAMQLKAFLPVTTYVNRFFKDFRHRFMFSFHPLFIGGHPFRSPSIYLMIPFLEQKDGVWFTKGGMYTVVSALKKLFIEQGGILKTDAEVSEISIENGKTNGVYVDREFMPADVVVSNADFAHTYRHLVNPKWRKKWTDKKIDKIKYSMSCYLLYLGVKKQFPDLEHHTLILSERYKGLVDDIFDGSPLPEDFSMYLHVPTKSDPDMAPPGCESIYILIPVSNLSAGTDWENNKDEFTERVLNFLEAWGMDGLKENIEVQEVFTPLEFESELNAYQGNAFAIEPKLTQTAYFRPHNRSEDVKGLYFVGAGTHPGAGVPGVILSAEATAGCVLEDVIESSVVPA